METMLVTGGAGFIGSNFIRHIMNTYKSYKIINLDKLTYAGDSSRLDDLSENYQFIKGDICDKDLVHGLMNQVDYIINFAAESHVDRSIESPDIFVQTNIVGTHVLLEAALKANIKKFVQISTDEVYGSLGKDGYFVEETPVAPNSPYSSSKASADLMARAYYHTYGLPVVITRCSNNYGPYQFPEKLIPLFIYNALNDKPLPVYGDGLNVRDWLYVEDHCRAIDKVLHHGKLGEVYNIGGNNEKTNIEITKIILNALGKPESLIAFVEDRLGHDRRYAIDASKIKRELNWEPSVKFESGIEKTIQWYLKHN